MNTQETSTQVSIEHFIASSRTRLTEMGTALKQKQTDVAASIMSNLQSSQAVGRIQALVSSSAERLAEFKSYLANKVAAIHSPEVRVLMGGLLTLMGAAALTSQAPLIGIALMFIGIVVIFGPALRDYLSELVQFVETQIGLID